MEWAQQIRKLGAAFAQSKNTHTHTCIHIHTQGFAFLANILFCEVDRSEVCRLRKIVETKNPLLLRPNSDNTISANHNSESLQGSYNATENESLQQSKLKILK